jgi:hypothetical protein
MNRTIKEATVRRFYYDTHSSLRTHLAVFLDAYNFAKRLKSLRGLTPFERMGQLWTEEPERFGLNPLHHMAGLNILVLRKRHRVEHGARVNTSDSQAIQAFRGQ